MEGNATTSQVMLEGGREIKDLAGGTAGEDGWMNKGRNEGRRWRREIRKGNASRDVKIGPGLVGAGHVMWTIHRRGGPRLAAVVVVAVVRTSRRSMQ